MSLHGSEIGQRWSDGRKELGLPESAESLLEQLHLPFIEVLQKWHQQKGDTVVVGLQGCQGSGKTTLCHLIGPLALDLLGLRIAVVALDDVYLSLHERQLLARDQHPLWITRGVPGTHDTGLACEILTSLRDRQQQPTIVPTFDKGIDDRLGESSSRTIEGDHDVVIFEGWCTGLGACTEFDWDTPINDLERDEDADMVWRNRIRDQLAGPYQQLFGLFDHLAMMKVPTWETVSIWRGQQEQKLRQERGDNATHSMDAGALQRFLDHYERLTRWTIETLPDRADFVASIAQDRSILSIESDLEAR